MRRRVDGPDPPGVVGAVRRRPTGNYIASCCLRVHMAKTPRLQLPIVGRRLLLRAPELTDASAIASALRDRRVTRPIHLPARYTIHDARDFIRRSKQGLKDEARYNLSIFLRGERELIGGCGLDHILLDHRNAHVGYWIARPHWGNGYASEAASLLIAAGFRDLGLHRIHTGVFPDNPRSIRVLRRLGFRAEGRARQDRLVDGRYRDLVLFGLLRGEFRPFRPRNAP
jgi:[ribosomal protein S5]-alanine N-acetyltransferase